MVVYCRITRIYTYIYSIYPYDITMCIVYTHAHDGGDHGLAIGLYTVHIVMVCDRGQGGKGACDERLHVVCSAATRPH